MDPRAESLEYRIHEQQGLDESQLREFFLHEVIGNIEQLTCICSQEGYKKKTQPHFTGQLIGFSVALPVSFCRLRGLRENHLPACRAKPSPLTGAELRATFSLNYVGN